MCGRLQMFPFTSFGFYLQAFGEISKSTMAQVAHTGKPYDPLPMKADTCDTTLSKVR